MKKQRLKLRFNREEKGRQYFKMYLDISKGIKIGEGQDLQKNAQASRNPLETWAMNKIVANELLIWERYSLTKIYGSVKDLFISKKTRTKDKGKTMSLFDF